ncbi:MAG: hypothetical protein LBT91_03420 [Bifidobacteriaceae bacterium]|jgi:hypothetical protein|nr:hypothetical protein [Bifidobacteriaceae bacterium]
MARKGSFGDGFIEIGNKAKKNIRNIEQLKNELTNHEILTYNNMANKNFKGTLIPIDKNRGKPSNDIYFAGKEWEIKRTMPKYKKISNLIREARRKARKQDVVKENFIYEAGNYKVNDKLKQQLSLYNIRNPNNKIKNLLIFAKDKFIKIKLQKKISGTIPPFLTV